MQNPSPTTLRPDCIGPGCRQQHAHYLSLTGGFTTVSFADRRSPSYRGAMRDSRSGISSLAFCMSSRGQPRRRSCRSCRTLSRPSSRRWATARSLSRSSARHGNSRHWFRQKTCHAFWIACYRSHGTERTRCYNCPTAVVVAYPPLRVTQCGSAP